MYRVLYVSCFVCIDCMHCIVLGCMALCRIVLYCVYSVTCMYCTVGTVCMFGVVVTVHYVSQEVVDSMEGLVIS